MSDRKTRIVVLGGGFGGMYAALRLEATLGKRKDVEVTLVNRDNFFLFTPMLHEVAASDLDPSDRYPDVAGQPLRRPFPEQLCDDQSGR